MSELSEATAAVNALLVRYGVTRDEMADVLSGPADGGPEGNGYYPVTLADGISTVLVPSPQKIAAIGVDVTSIVGDGSLILLVEDRTYATKALQDANLTPDAGKWALVHSDPDPANDGFSIKVGATGVGSWSLRLPLAYSRALADLAASAAELLAPVVATATDAAADAQTALGETEAIAGPVIAIAAAVRTTVPSGYLHIFTDKDGLIPGGVTEAGLLMFQQASFGGLSLTNLLTIAGVSRVAPAASGLLASVSDMNGRIPWAVKASGAMAAGAIEDLQTINGVPVTALTSLASFPKTTVRPVIRPGWYLALHYGQSNSAGAEQTAITTAQVAPSDGYRFSNGVRAHNNDASDATARAAYSALLENDGTLGGGSYGETAASGMDIALKQRFLSRFGLAPADLNYRLFHINEGLGSQSVAPHPAAPAAAGLNVGTAQYNRLIGDITAVKPFADAVPAQVLGAHLHLNQGERDYFYGTTADAWEAEWNIVMDALQAHIVTTFGAGAGTLTCSLAQTNRHDQNGHTGNPYLALRMRRMCRFSPRWNLACPMYPLPYAAGSGSHLSAIGQRVQGYYAERVYERIAIDGKPWEHLDVQQVQRISTTKIRLRFNPESGKLAFGTNAALTGQTNYGFTLSTGTIASVVIEDDIWVAVTATADIAAGTEIRYGYGGYGNLRDTLGDTLVFDPAGTAWPMHNWAPILKATVV